ncbi:KTSC domain-containing protein [Delftia sp. HK171]|uniref:KTSC domain-containing protein n=1 Tax=Delftia sp. HK171 TaxID=1920191 RepID=UPI0011515398|nr:KTSC domain-containing protein [Delftia sp. HK171]
MPQGKSPLGLRWVLLHNHFERAKPMETHSFAGSRTLVQGTYSPDTHLLRLWFTSSPDRPYDYPRVPEHIWTGLKAARSAGEYYNLHIRDQYGEPRAPANPWRRR